jgi:hypothetical protein
MKLKYPNTNNCPQIGDVVRFVDDDSTMVVEDVIDTQKKREKWGLEENVIMMKGEKYGLISDHLNKDSDVLFIQRKKMSKRELK